MACSGVCGGLHLGWPWGISWDLKSHFHHNCPYGLGKPFFIRIGATSIHELKNTLSCQPRYISIVPFASFSLGRCLRTGQFHVFKGDWLGLPGAADIDILPIPVLPSCSICQLGSVCMTCTSLQAVCDASFPLKGSKLMRVSSSVTMYVGRRLSTSSANS